MAENKIDRRILVIAFARALERFAKDRNILTGYLDMSCYPDDPSVNTFHIYPGVADDEFPKPIPISSLFESIEFKCKSAPGFIKALKEEFEKALNE